jgi:hypothetical protein
MIFFIKPNTSFTQPARWFVSFLERHLQTTFVVTDKDSLETAKDIFKISDDADSDVPMALAFYEKIDKGIFNHEQHFVNEPLIRTETGAIDYIATIFYMVNCLQEYGVQAVDLDNYNRFRYESSFQARFGTIQEDSVTVLIEKFVKILRGSFGDIKKRPSRVFLTHDIDSLYGSFVQDGLWAMKRGRFDVLLRLVLNEVLRQPAYFNIDKMLKIHSEYDLKSTFFWIAAQGRSADGIKNADYNLKNPTIQNALWAIQKHGSEIGLHKSSLDSSFETEFGRLPEGHIRANRYHFLRFQLPKSWEMMEDAGVQLDASLGFASAYGFRNGYGLPFHPYDFRTKKAMNLLVTPLNIMDGTLSYYMRVPTAEISRQIISFFETHKKDCVLGLLWHNTEFSELQFAPFLKIYKEILAWIVETKMETMTASEVLKTFLY